jgi:hypothetical protein
MIRGSSSVGIYGDVVEATIKRTTVGPPLLLAAS